ncbi:MAG: four helix bundle protein [Bacteroidales bacterium]|nr:four helix bundle protein [Bacteroidales bacterium]
MNPQELQKRVKQFALRVIKLAALLPNNRVGWTFCDQIVRSATSSASNYRAACRAKSDKDFISKLETTIEETDETLFWLEMIEETNIIDQSEEITILKTEANELLSIFVSSVRTVKIRLNKLKP